MSYISHVPIKDSNSDEQSFDLIFLLEMQIKNLLDSIGSIELGNDVSLLLLEQCISNLLREAHVFFINLVHIFFVFMILFRVEIVKVDKKLFLLTET